MNLLVYADGGPQLAALLPAISGLGNHAPRLVTSWEALEAACDEDVPDVVVLCFAVFAGAEPRVAIEAREELRQRGIPPIALISAGGAAERRLAEMIAGFEVVLEGAPSAAELQAAIERSVAAEGSVIRQVLSSSDYAGAELAADADEMSGLFQSELEEAERDEARMSLGSLDFSFDEVLPGPGDEDFSSGFGSSGLDFDDDAGDDVDAGAGGYDDANEASSWGQEVGEGVLEVEDDWLEPVSDPDLEQPQPAGDVFARGGAGLITEELSAPEDEVEPEGGWARWDDMDLGDEEPEGYDDAQLDADVHDFLHDLHEAVGSSYEDEVSPADEIADELEEHYGEDDGQKPLPSDLLSGRVKAPPPVDDPVTGPIEVRDWGSRSSLGESEAPERPARSPRPAEPELVLHPDLPPLMRGSLSDSSPLELLAAHGIAGSTGRMVFTMDRIQRDVALRKGVIGLMDVRQISDSAVEKVVSALVWDHGTYSFTPGAITSQRFVAFDSMLLLAFQAIERGMTTNQALHPLTPFLRKYPVPTNRAERYRVELRKVPVADQFLASCGEHPLEEIAGSSSGAERMLKAALLCHWLHLVAFLDEPRLSPVTLEFDVAALQEELRDVAERENRPRSGPRVDERRLMEDLVRRAEQFSKQTPYQILGIEEGCGRAAVKDAYYRAVKEHHPDTYALAKTPSIKPMAEMVFRLVRKAYAELDRIESDEPRAGASPGGRQRSAGTGPAPRVGSAARPAARGGANPSENTRRNSGAYHYARTPTSQGGASSPSPSPPAGPARSNQGSAAPPNAGAPPSPTRPRPAVERAPAPRNPAATTGPGPARPARRRPPGRRSGPNARSVTQGSLTGAKEAVRGPKKPELSPKEHYKNGLTLLSAGQADRALEAFKEASEAEPDNVAYLAHHAWSQYLTDPETARDVVAVLKRAIAESDETSVEWPALFMGHILSAEGQEDQAVGYYRECLHGNPRNVEAKRRLRLYDMRTKTGGSFLDKLFSGSKSKSKDTKKKTKR